MKLRQAGKTHVGIKRTHNEDSFSCLPEERLFIVADGMGGHASGEIASSLAVETVTDFFNATAEDDEITWPYKMDKSKKYDENRLITSIKLANLRIFEAAAEDPRKKGMGTTVVAALFTDDCIYLGHVGDSRIYVIRDNEIRQLTEDHSLLNRYMKMKTLTPEEIENFPHKNVIVRALGMNETVQVDCGVEQPRVGDIYLLCSDGLSGMVNDPTLLEVVSSNRHDLEVACDRLIEEANKNGGVDNISVILVEVVEV